MEEDGVDLAVRRLDLGLVSVTGKGKSSSNSWKTLSSFTAPSTTVGHSVVAPIAAHHAPPDTNQESGYLVTTPPYLQQLQPLTSTTCPPGPTPRVSEPGDLVHRVPLGVARFVASASPPTPPPGPLLHLFPTLMVSATPTPLSNGPILTFSAIGCAFTLSTTLQNDVTLHQRRGIGLPGFIGLG